ncbi:MAG: hypothetical protein ABN483_09915, partial [Pantoea agglomerans]
REKRYSHQGIFHKATPLSGYDDGDPKPVQREQMWKRDRHLQSWSALFRVDLNNSEQDRALIYA